MPHHCRRTFLKISAAAACTLVISKGLHAKKPTHRFKYKGSSVRFDHGVASGDPLQDKVIIWTRVTPQKDKPKQRIHIFFELSDDPDFKRVLHQGRLFTTQDLDYTVKVDVHNLKPDQTYYYRFFSRGIFSPIGRTKTLPISTPQSISLAVVSCANYPKGYFNVYKEASTLDSIDAVLHLGDYIYEYGMFNADGTPAYATENAQAIGRALPEDNDQTCVSLEDYRKRYALYHTDEGLKALHAKFPFILVWDDHEVADDAYKEGALGHDEALHGNYRQRKEAAMQAYFEWLPIRPLSRGNYNEIYRSFDFGSLVSLHVLDTRHVGRDKQLDYADYFQFDPQTQSINIDVTRFIQDIHDPNRTLLGIDQKQWLQNQLSSSNATWQVLGQQVLMGRMKLPAELLILISQLDSNDPTVVEAVTDALNRAFSELATIKYRMLHGDPTLTEAEKQRVTHALPYNLDAWDGYAHDRNELMDTVKALNQNLIVLSGDTHNSWANHLKNDEEKAVGVEFATAAVTSPGIEAYLRLNVESAHAFEQLLTLLIDDLVYTNQNDRGFMTITFTEQEAKATWHYIDNNDSTTYASILAREKSFTVQSGTHTTS